jgi:integrase
MTKKPRRPARTFGEITKLPSDRFRARYWGPDGQRYNAPHTYVARTDAEGWLADQERAISRGDWELPRPAPKPAPAMLFGAYAKEAIKQRNLRPSTVELYEKLLRLAILPAFEDAAITAITPDEVREWYIGMKSTPTQQANAYGLMKSIMKQAVEERLLAENPCLVRGGSQKETAREIEVLTIGQLAAYIEAVREHRRIPLLLAGWCGLRSGEVRGLRMQDLDFDAGVVHVHQAVTRVKGKLLIGPPKTKAGVRAISIPPHLLPGLRVWREQNANRPRGALAFPASDGTSPMHDSTLRDAHYEGRAAIGMPSFTVHDLRHTSATIAAQLGATIAELQARIGHSTPNMAMRYQHVAAHRDAELAARMSRLANGETSNVTRVNDADEQAASRKRSGVRSSGSGRVRGNAVRRRRRD